jgi:hypothetical protein
MKNLQFLSAAALLAVVATSVEAQLYTQNFDTAGGLSTLTRRDINAADNSVNDSFNYGTHVNATGTAVPIPSAPNSTGGSTVGLRVDVNQAAGAVNTVVLFPNPAAALPAQYTLQFDMWANFATDNTSTTTEFFSFGAAADASAVISQSPSGSNAFNIAITTEGGSGTDARYAEGTGAIAVNNAKPGWPTSSETVNAGPSDDWIDWLPLTTTTPLPPNDGNWFYRWTTIELQVNQTSSSATVFVTPAGGTRSQVASFSYVGGAARPFFGLTDLFTSLGGADTFVVFDNVQIIDNTPPPVSAAENWAVYQ